MGKRDIFEIRILIKHPTLDIKYLNQELKIKPDHSWCAGEQKTTPVGRVIGGINKETMWTKTYHFPDRNDFFQCLYEVIKLFEDRKDFIKEIGINGNVFFLVDFFGVPKIGDVMPNDGISIINDMNAKLGMEIF